MDLETIARVCHEANRALQVAQADPTIPVAAPWDDCGAEMQASAVESQKVKDALFVAVVRALS